MHMRLYNGRQARQEWMAERILYIREESRLCEANCGEESRLCETIVERKAGYVK